MARTVLYLAGAMLALAAPASAQTAGDINRLNQAVQICNSPMGAGMGECARLRGQLGMGGAPGGGLGSALGGGKGAAAAGLLGALNSAMNARQAPAQVPPPASSANPQLIAECVKAAAGNTDAIQACLSTASAPRPSAPTFGGAAGVPRLGQPIMPGAAGGQGSAMAIHQAGQSYQACAAANPANWQSCLPLLNGGQPR